MNATFYRSTRTAHVRVPAAAAHQQGIARMNIALRASQRASDIQKRIEGS
jgi:hypothetical protein